MIQSVSEIAKHQDCRFRRERRASHSVAPKHHQSRATPSDKHVFLCEKFILRKKNKKCNYHTLFWSDEIELNCGALLVLIAGVALVCT